MREIQSRLPGLSKDELIEVAAEALVLARRDDREGTKIDWSQFDGLIQHGPDPSEYQRAIREEWDRENRP